MAEGGLLRRPNEDRFANIMSADQTESAANTLTWQEIDIGIGLGSGVGLLVDQIDYYVAQSLSHAANDGLFMAWSLTNDITDLTNEFDNPRVIHISSVFHQLTTSGATALRYPHSHKFTPPMITAGNRGKLYFGVQGVSLGAAIRGQSRFYFRYIKLTDRDYLELAESFALFG